MSDAPRVTTTVTFDIPRASSPIPGLTPDEHRAHAAMLMKELLDTSEAVDRPQAILTGGQPGSGKSAIVASARSSFETKGGAVVIDPDEIRPTLPYMHDRIARGDLDIPNEANVDAGTIAYQMIQIAKSERRNLVIDGTLQNTRRALDLAGEMKAAGYEVQFHGMAVHPDLSHARTYSRREEQIARSPTGFGRGVSDEFHDQAVEGYRNTVEAFQTRSAVDSMTFYGPNGKIAETRFENGQWTPDISMKERMELEQRHPGLREMIAATDAWWTAAKAMNKRGAPAEEIDKVRAFGSFAALQERQLRATSVRATIDFGTTHSAQPAQDMEMPAVERHDLTNESLRSLAALVHSGIKTAGRDADQAIMTVNWEGSQAFLDVRTPASHGYERMMMPQHERIERAIGGIVRDGSLEVDYATETARVRDMPTRTLDAKARALGLAAADFGIGDVSGEPTIARNADRETGPARNAAIIAIMRQRTQER